MISHARIWFAGLSRREQYLVGVAGLLSAALLLVFAIVLGRSAIERAVLAHDEAVERRGRIETTVANAVERRASGSPVGNADINLVVTQSAAEQGFDLVSSASTGAGRMTFRIDRARAPALVGWLSRLETEGIEANSVTMRGGPDGVVIVEAQLLRVAR